MHVYKEKEEMLIDAQAPRKEVRLKRRIERMWVNLHRMKTEEARTARQGGQLAGQLGSKKTGKEVRKEATK